MGFLASDALLRGGAAAMLPGISGVALVFQVFGAAGIAWTTAWLLLVPRFEVGRGTLEPTSVIIAWEPTYQSKELVPPGSS